MPRAMWSGSISFGLVSVPVKLYAAVQQKDIGFHQIDEKSGARIKYKRVSAKTGREVPYEQIAKGYELDDDKYVVIDREELEEIAPEKTRRIDVQEFVDISEIDPIYFEHTYFIAPDQGGDKAYALLRKAMEDTGRIAIGRLVMRTKEYLAAIRPYDKRALALHTMLFPDEIVDVNDISGVPERMPRVHDNEVKMARQLIDALTTEFDPAAHTDEYRERVLELIKAKAKGKTLEIPEAEEPPKVIDLVEALKASLENSKGSGGSRGKRSTGKAKSGGSKSGSSKSGARSRKKKSA